MHIILVNWNGYDDTVACVESCMTLAYSPFSVIVVDNGSPDGSGERLAEHFAGDARVTVILTGENLGFAGGNNVGIRNALMDRAAYVWLLNNDTIVEPQTLRALVDAARANPKAGMLGSKVYYHDRPDVLWFAGGCIKPERNGTTYHRGIDEVDEGQYDRLEEVDYVTGASLFVSTTLVRRIGVMAEEYFLYWEEVDFCERARAEGYPCLYVPASRVWHKVGASLGASDSPAQIRYDARNRLVFYKRHRPGELPRVMFWLTRQIVSLALLKRKGGHARALWRGEWDFIRGRSGRIDVA